MLSNIIIFASLQVWFFSLLCIHVSSTACAFFRRGCPRPLVSIGRVSNQAASAIIREHDRVTQAMLPNATLARKDPKLGTARRQGGFKAIALLFHNKTMAPLPPAIEFNLKP